MRYPPSWGRGGVGWWGGLFGHHSLWIGHTVRPVRRPPDIEKDESRN